MGPCKYSQVITCPPGETVEGEPQLPEARRAGVCRAQPASGHAHNRQKFRGQERTPRHSSDPSHCTAARDCHAQLSH